ncbi:MAG: FAD-dependent oxidoreductase [Archaeoglobaceae archaeon]
MVVIVGAGYSGLICARNLIDFGYSVRLFDFRKAGGELAIFSKIPELKEHYESFVDEMKSVLGDLNVEKGCVISTDPLRILTPKGVEIVDDKAIIATGAVDRNPWVYGKRPAGIFSPETAIKLISEGYKIGNSFLIAGDGEVLELLATHLSKNHKVERVKSTEVYVHGNKRVEKVEVEGEEFKCDTLILFRGRKTFNPKNLLGDLVGNAVVCSYDYSLVRKNVREFIKKFTASPNLFSRV